MVVSSSSDVLSIPVLEGTQVFQEAIATLYDMDYKRGDRECSRSSYLRSHLWARSTLITSELGLQTISLTHLAQNCHLSTCPTKGKLWQRGNILWSWGTHDTAMLTLLLLEVKAVTSEKCLKSLTMELTGGGSDTTETVVYIRNCLKPDMVLHA